MLQNLTVSPQVVELEVILNLKKYHGDIFHLDTPQKVEHHKISHVHNIKVVADKCHLEKHLNLGAPCYNDSNFH